MPLAKLDQLELNYVEEGSGHPVLFIHGFASTAQINWGGPGWLKKLAGAGFRAIAFDNRGHGGSTKFHQISDYSLDIMAADALALLDYLEIETAHVMGYSMGARISAVLAHTDQDGRVGRLVLSGNGYNMIDGGFDSERIRDGLLASDLASVTDPVGQAFRAFAEQTGSDLEALASCIMGARTRFERTVFEGIRNPTLVAVGTEDDVALDGDRLAAIMPNAEFFPIQGRNHMNAVGDGSHKQAVLEFLSR